MTTLTAIHFQTVSYKFKVREELNEFSSCSDSRKLSIVYTLRKLEKINCENLCSTDKDETMFFYERLNLTNSVFVADTKIFYITLCHVLDLFLMKDLEVIWWHKNSKQVDKKISES